MHFSIDHKNIDLMEKYIFILEKAMATHSSTLAWKIPWEELHRLQSVGSLLANGAARPLPDQCMISHVISP